MRRFSAEYLGHTREGLWDGDREALADLSLADRERVLDAGCGTGEFTRVLAEEAGGRVLGVDADPALLEAARDAGLAVAAGDATRLPVPDGAVDLVACQALLINLPDPAAAVAEFARASGELVAAVEPDNAAVAVDSTVDREVTLESRAREAFLAGVDTDLAPGSRVAELFRRAGLRDVRSRRHRHEKRIEPPYDEAALAGAARKASGAGLADHERELRAALPAPEYDRLRTAWREMGREVVAQMRAGEYRRVETVPFEVTVGRVPGG